MHSLHPGPASSQLSAQLDAQSSKPSINGRQPEAAAATQAGASETDAAAAASPKPGVLVVFADGSTALTSVVGDELRLGAVTAALGGAAAADQVMIPTTRSSAEDMCMKSVSDLVSTQPSRHSSARSIMLGNHSSTEHALLQVPQQANAQGDVPQQLAVGCGSDRSLAVSSAAVGPTATVCMHRRQVGFQPLLRASDPSTEAVGHIPAYSLTSLRHFA